MDLSTERVPMPKSLRATFSPMSDPTGRVGSLVLVAGDITPEKGMAPRKDAIGSDPEVGRLIAALEAERSHIARELHDDIAQSLAVLVMQMWRAGKPVSDTTGKQPAAIPALCEQVQSIAARVTRLARELHSSSLESRGLEKTIRAVCDEFSDGHRTPVSFVCEDIPIELDGRVALCLLRVVQEALQNVAKHSRATRVDVVLTSLRGNEFMLVVVDDGVGFDVSEASQAEGIGLINMRERVRCVGGTFTISSTPGAGTRIQARLPVRPKAA